MLIKINDSLLVNTGLMKSITSNDDHCFAINFSDNTSEAITKEEHGKLLDFLKYRDLQSLGAQQEGRENAE